MKKTLLVFILTMILFPVVSCAKEIEINQPIISFKWEEISYMEGNTSYIYALDYEYDGEKYNLSGEQRTDNIDFLKRFFWQNKEIAYTCKSQTETSCSELSVLFLKSEAAISRKVLTIKLKDGERVEDKSNIRFLEVADNYTVNNGVYELLNPDTWDLFSIPSNYFDLARKYTCRGNITSCSEIYYFLVSGEIQSLVVSKKDDFLLANNYRYENGRIVLEYILESQWPNYEDFAGHYTCLTKSKVCEDKVYLTESFTKPTIFITYGGYEAYDEGIWKVREIENPLKNIIGNAGDIKELELTIASLDEMKVVDDSIVEIKDGKLVLLKEGETDIIKKDSPENVLYHIIVRKSDLSNPKTNSYSQTFIVLILTLITIVTIVVSKRENNNN